MISQDCLVPKVKEKKNIGANSGSAGKGKR